MREARTPSFVILRGAIVPALWVGALFYLAIFLFHGFQVVDEGVALVDAWRISEGQLPHRDFFEIIPPLSFLPTAALFKCFGPSLLVSRALSAFYGLLLIYLTDHLVKSLTASVAVRAAAIAFLIPFGTSYWPIPSHHWVADLCCLASAICLKKAMGSIVPWWWAFAAGALAGAGLFSLQDQGVYFAVGIVLLFLPSLAREVRRSISWGWLFGVGAVGVLAGGFLVLTASPSSLLEQWLLFPLQRYGGIAGNNGWGISILGFMRESVTLQGAPGAVSFRLLHLLMILALSLMPVLAAGSLFWGIGTATKEKRPLLWLVAALFIAFAGAALHRLSLTNLVWALPAMLLACAIPSQAETGSRFVEVAKFWRKGALVLTVVAILFSLLFAVQSFQGMRTTVTTPAGKLWMTNAVEAESLQEVVFAVQSHLPPGTALFCRTPVPLVNFLCLRPNPTPYTLFVYPGYHTDQQAEQVIQGLQEQADAWVLDTGPPKSLTVLDRFLSSEYEIAWDQGYARLLRRKGHSGAGFPSPNPKVYS